MKSLKVQLAGGLGNQLFQLSAGLYFSKTYQKPLKLIRAEKSDSKYFHDFGLANIPGIDVSSRNRILRSKLGGLIWRVDRKLLNKSKTFQRLRHIYEPSEGTSNQLNRSKVFELRGYFQELKYAEFARDSIKEILKNVKIDKRKWIEIDNGYISLHIRRGDYLKLTDIYGTLGTNYYSESLARCAKVIGSKKVIVFSDDIAEAEKLLAGSEFDVYDFQFVPAGYSPIESIILMSKCSAHILANSTFSWWGAFISDKSRITTFPSPWTKHHDPEPDFFPRNWVRVPANWL